MLAKIVGPRETFHARGRARRRGGRYLATKLGEGRGDAISVTVARAGRGRVHAAPVDVLVTNVFSTGSSSTRAGCSSISLEARELIGAGSTANLIEMKLQPGATSIATGDTRSAPKIATPSVTGGR
jgi:hypothetical protein